LQAMGFRMAICDDEAADCEKIRASLPRQLAMLDVELVAVLANLPGNALSGNRPTVSGFRSPENEA